MTHQFVEVAFRRSGELFLFDAGELELKSEDRVVVDTEHGQALGTVKSANLSDITPPSNFKLFRVVRVASAEDLNRESRHQRKEEEAFEYCNTKIIEFDLPMKLIRAEYFFSGSKLLFYFSAEGRVDFRALVRDLARYFQKRIEMRQIGVRDSAKLIGGVGPCGQQLCCNRFLRQFNPVSIRMAKDQSLPLNPQKVSGVCGRLMCCLAYEQTLYQEMRKRLPKVGEDVQTPQGVGKVREVFPLQEKVRVVFWNHETPGEEEYHIDALEGFGEVPLPDFIPVIPRGKGDKNRNKKRAKRGLEPLMEPRHPGRSPGRKGQKPQPLPLTRERLERGVEREEPPAPKRELGGKRQESRKKKPVKGKGGKRRPSASEGSDSQEPQEAQEMPVNSSAHEAPTSPQGGVDSAAIARVEAALVKASHAKTEVIVTESTVIETLVTETVVAAVVSENAPQEAKEAHQEVKEASQETKAPQEAKGAPQEAKDAPQEAKDAPQESKKAPNKRPPKGRGQGDKGKRRPRKEGGNNQQQEGGDQEGKRPRRRRKKRKPKGGGGGKSGS